MVSTVYHLLEDLIIPVTTVSVILTEHLAMKHVAAKFVPRLLSQERKEVSAKVEQDLLESAGSDLNFLETIITRDGFKGVLL